MILGDDHLRKGVSGSQSVLFSRKCFGYEHLFFHKFHLKAIAIFRLWKNVYFIIINTFFSNCVTHIFLLR